MKVLLFGANGFLGKETSDLLKRDNFEVFTVSRNDKKTNYLIDISKYADFKSLPNDFFEVIINCATVLPGGNFLDNNYLDKIYKTNILGTQNICKWIETQNSVKSIINCSTLVVAKKPWKIDIDEQTATYPHGNHVLYCSSKLMQELIFQTLADAKKMNVTHIRFSALYGKSMNWSGIICNLIDQAKKSKEIRLTNASKVYADFLNVKDAAKIIMVSIQNSISGILNAASGKEISILNLAKLIKENIDNTILITNVEVEDFIEDRAKINIDKLKKSIDVEDFIQINSGLIEMIRK